jgi:hypothetical protein
MIPAETIVSKGSILLLPLGHFCRYFIKALDALRITRNASRLSIEAQ